MKTNPLEKMKKLSVFKIVNPPFFVNTVRYIFLHILYECHPKYRRTASE